MRTATPRAHDPTPGAERLSTLSRWASLPSLLFVSVVACTSRRPPAASSGTVPARATTSVRVGSGLSARPSVAIDGGARTDAGTHAREGASVAPDGMIRVPGGTFVMGSDVGGQQDEHPAHRVTLASFFLDRTEVTNGAYAACVSAGKCGAPDPASARRSHFGPDSAFRGAEQPVSSISWGDARAYCGFVGKRLPTEAEFERAARGDDERTYAWGNEPPSAERAVYGTTRTSNVGTHPAGAGPYGHLDLAGNVWEWLEDFYDPDAYRRPGAAHGIPGTCDEIRAAQDALRSSGRQGFTGSNPIPTECEHVLRGGAFNYGGPGLRASNRVHHPGRFKLIMAGVRCAKDAE